MSSTASELEITDGEICNADHKAQEIYRTLVAGESRHTLMWLSSYLMRLRYTGSLDSDEDFAVLKDSAEGGTLP